MDAALMILPPAPCRFICSAAACMLYTTPNRLISNMRCRSSGVSSSSVFTWAMPALATITSTVRLRGTEYVGAAHRGDTKIFTFSSLLSMSCRNPPSTMSSRPMRPVMNWSAATLPSCRSLIVSGWSPQ